MPSFVLDGVEVVEAHHAGVAVLERRLLRTPRRRATDVEGAHGELGAGLADGLGSDDADRLADVHLRPRARSRP